MALEVGTTTHGFTVVSHDDLAEIEGRAIVARHDVSGARLLYLKNDDNNKSFGIGFRTPPADDTGVFHILEHSVLCGSRKFPVKEPFVDLLKGSMQTFLNAMTFSDKTLYPVASTNEQDLYNLMDVYLDAVFHPRIYDKRAIFEQEGWHYELAEPEAAEGQDEGQDEGQLVYNGVVYNEMKGALSNASSVLYDEVQKALFPDTPYAFESGGTPASIPTLTYEGYLDEHRRHYRTDNSYIVLYGNLDIDRALAFLDERYLTPVAAEQDAADEERRRAGLDLLRPRVITHQPPARAGYVRKTMDTAPENACAASGYVIGEASDFMRVTAVDILLDALFGSNEAPLTRALLDEGVAHDVTAFVADAVLQPFAIVQLQVPAEGAAEALQETVARHVRALLEKGLDKNLVEAALSHAEFVMREHEMGIADGVYNAMVALAGWLYDDEAATVYLRYEAVFAKLRAALEGDYFETLLREMFLDNPHTASVEVVPTPGESDDDTGERLAAKLAGLTADERAGIVAAQEELRALQAAPDTPEAIATLPRLSVADIGEAPQEPAYGIDESAPLTCLRHEVSTRGIAYAYRYFDLARLTFDELPYAAILTHVLGKLGTASHTAAELDMLVQGKLGNLSVFSDIFENPEDKEAPQPRLVVSSSCLPQNIEWLAKLPREIIVETDFSDTDRMLDVLKQAKISMEQSFIGAGHRCAMARVRSYYSRIGVIHEQVGNVGFYQFLCDLLEHFDERRADLTARLESVAAHLFCDDACLVSFAGSDADYEAFWAAGPAIGRAGGERRLVVPEPHCAREAFVVPGDVCYAAQGWDRRMLGEEYSGDWILASRVLTLDYLWNEVRVKGGAYGVGFNVMASGNMRFYSFRDPHLDETVERFAQAGPWLSDFNPSREELEGFIVSCVAAFDAPIKPRLLIRRQTSDYLTKRSADWRRGLRDQVISASVPALQAVGEPIARMAQQDALCVFGNRAILEGSKLGLKIVPLVG